MSFMVYKPKAAKNVKADQVTEKNIDEIVSNFFGTAKSDKNPDGVLFVSIATFDGVITAIESEWILRTDDGITVMGDEEFNEKYERARIVTSKD